MAPPLRHGIAAVLLGLASNSCLSDDANAYSKLAVGSNSPNNAAFGHAPHGNTDWQLADAVRAGRSAEVQRLLDRANSPDSRDRSGTPALVWAAKSGRIHSLNRLLNAGADPARTDRSGVNALMWASWRGDRAATATLLEAGADPNIRDRFGFTPLWIYSYNSSTGVLSGDGPPGIAQQLLSAGARVNSAGPGGTTALMLAAARGNRSLAEALVGAGARSDLRDQQQRTALHHALRNGHSTLLPSLLNGNSRALDAADRDGLTPLHTALLLGDLGAIDALLQAGANANGQPNSTPNGRQPSPLALAIATSHCRGQPTETLLRAGADPSSRDHHGNPALKLSIERRCLGLSERLIEAGADLHARAGDHSGALVWAMRSGQLGLVNDLLDAGLREPGGADGDASALIALLESPQPSPRLMLRLLEAGANPAASDNNGTPALLLAVRLGELDTVELLLRHGAKVDDSDARGTTALMLAARAGDLALSQRLLQAGADPDRRDHSYAQSARNLARLAGHQAVEQLLDHHQNAKDAGHPPPLTALAR